MIKLIATDMDHTLLDNASNLPENFEEVVNELHNKGIHFVLASGRTLFSIKDKAHDYLDKLNFISDNGAVLEYENKIEFISGIDKISVNEILNVCRNCTEATIIASALDTAYAEVYSQEHADLLNEYYDNFQVVDDISKVDDVFVKITMLSLENTFDNYELIPNSMLETNSCVLAGKWWIDIMNEGISKGNALRQLIDMLGIHESEVAAFGDFHNDITMLELAKYSFAVSNAHDDVKAIASDIIGSNDDSAVTNKIIEIVK